MRSVVRIASLNITLHWAPWVLIWAAPAHPGARLAPLNSAWTLGSGSPSGQEAVLPHRAGGRAQVLTSRCDLCPPGRVQATPIRGHSPNLAPPAHVKGNLTKCCCPGPRGTAQPLRLPPAPVHSAAWSTEPAGPSHLEPQRHPRGLCHHRRGFDGATHFVSPHPRGLDLPDLGAGPHGAVGEGSLTLPDLLRQQAGQRREVNPWSKQRVQLAPLRGTPCPRVRAAGKFPVGIIQAWGVLQARIAPRNQQQHLAKEMLSLDERRWRERLLPPSPWLPHQLYSPGTCMWRVHLHTHTHWFTLAHALSHTHTRTLHIQQVRPDGLGTTVLGPGVMLPCSYLRCHHRRGERAQNFPYVSLQLPVNL